MTIRPLFERLWQQQCINYGPSVYKFNNPFLLKIEDLQTNRFKVYFLLENTEAVIFTTRLQGKEQTYLFLQRLKNRDCLLNDFMSHIPESHIVKICNHLKPFYQKLLKGKHPNDLRKLSIRVLCDE